MRSLPAVAEKTVSDTEFTEFREAEKPLVDARALTEPLGVQHVIIFSKNL
jgi:hypothetical protein